MRTAAYEAHQRERRGIAGKSEMRISFPAAILREPSLLRIGESISPDFASRNFCGRCQPISRNSSFPELGKTPHRINYALHEKGAFTQLCTLAQPFAKLVPIFVSLTPIQNTNATRRTTKVYSMIPWPSSSAQSRFSKSILIPSGVELFSTLPSYSMH
jgi:hypothetical protein